jgi:hypothetical protein
MRFVRKNDCGRTDCSSEALLLDYMLEELLLQGVLLLKLKIFHKFLANKSE